MASDGERQNDVDHLSLPRCPACRRPAVARMTAAGPAVVCPCQHPGEHFWGSGVAVTAGGPRPGEEDDDGCRRVEGKGKTR